MKSYGLYLLSSGSRSNEVEITKPSEDNITKRSEFIKNAQIIENNHILTIEYIIVKKYL